MKPKGQKSVQSKPNLLVIEKSLTARLWKCLNRRQTIDTSRPGFELSRSLQNFKVSHGTCHVPPTNIRDSTWDLLHETHVLLYYWGSNWIRWKMCALNLGVFPCHVLCFEYLQLPISCKSCGFGICLNYKLNIWEKRGQPVFPSCFIALCSVVLLCSGKELFLCRESTETKRRNSLYKNSYSLKRHST